MSEVLFRLGRFHAAIRYLERAHQHSSGLGGAYIAHIVALNRGSIYLALLDHASAVGVLNAALQQVRRSGRAGVAAQFHALLCLAYARGEDHLEAAVQERLALEGLSPDLEEDVRLDVLLPLAEAAESRSEE